MSTERPSDDINQRATELLEGRSLVDLELPPSYVSRLVHQLQVHQIELEMQNDELQRAWAVEEESSSQRADLFDLAPIPYVVVGRDGSMLNVNAAACMLFGDDPWNLVGRAVADVLSLGDRSRWRTALAHAFSSGVTDRIDVRLETAGRPEVQIRLAASTDGDTCRVILVDR